MNRNHIVIWVILLIICNISCNSNSGNSSSLSKGSKITGKVISIIDGDTYDLLTKDKKTIRIRMEGIDAPERGMPFYKVSKNYLGELGFQKDIKFVITNIDSYGRYLGYSYLKDGTELSYKMIKAGLAWHYKMYNNDTVLSKLEIEARNAKIGLWVGDHPMPPWENRKYHRMGISTKDSFAISGDGN